MADNNGVGDTNHARVTDPDTTYASLVGIGRGLLYEMQPKAPTTKTVTIANTASLSGGVDCGLGVVPLRVIAPASFEGASVTFQTSPDGVVAYGNVMKLDGSEYAVTVTPGASVALDPAVFVGARFIKVRSGTSGSPTTVGASRVVTLVVGKAP